MYSTAFIITFTGQRRRSNTGNTAFLHVRDPSRSGTDSLDSFFFVKLSVIVRFLSVASVCAAGRPRVLSRAFSFSSPLNFPHPLPLFPSSRVASCLSAPRGGEIWLLLLREGRTRSFFAFWDHHHHLFAAGPPSRVLPAAGSYREERKESGERERERERKRELPGCGGELT